MADVFEFKIGIPGAKINLRELFRRFQVRGGLPSLSVVPTRFLSVFNEHGIATSQIPRFIPELSLAKLGSSEALLSAITPELIDRTSRLFGVRREWMEGVDDVIYCRDFCYKRPRRFFAKLSALKPGYSEFPVRALYCTTNLDWRNEQYQPLVIFFVEQFGELGEDKLFRFHIFDEFDWSYAPSRIQLKAMARVLDRQFRITFPLYKVTERELEEVAEGRKTPQSLMRGSPITDPSLEDYALSMSESKVAKEVEELPRVLNYIEHHSLEQQPKETNAEAVD
jgi:hypothetical protein